MILRHHQVPPNVEKRVQSDMAKKALVLKQKNKRWRFSVRAYNRCKLCGNPRGFMRRFEICRKCFRELAHKGVLPGVKKASW